MGYLLVPRSLQHQHLLIFNSIFKSRLHNTQNSANDYVIISMEHPQPITLT